MESTILHSILRRNVLSGLDAFSDSIWRFPLHVTTEPEVVVQMLQASHYVQVVKFSDTWLLQRCKVLGHILTTNREDPLRQVNFETGTH